MVRATPFKTPLILCAMIAPLVLSACSETTQVFSAVALKDAVTPSFLKRASYSDQDKECMQRAMFFESHRSSREGMIAVGTVVMNRKRSGQHPNTVCGVVGEKRQFAPGVLTRKMKPMADVEEAAIAVLEGERHPKLKNAMHFHTAGLKFKYKNMNYVTVAGGNAFYEKRTRNWAPLPQEDNTTVLAAYDDQRRGRVVKAVVDTLTGRDEPEEKPKVVTAALSSPAKAKARKVVARAPEPVLDPAHAVEPVPNGIDAAEVEPVAASAAMPGYQPPANDPADIDPARFQ